MTYLRCFDLKKMYFMHLFMVRFVLKVSSQQYLDEPINNKLPYQPTLKCEKIASYDPNTCFEVIWDFEKIDMIPYPAEIRAFRRFRIFVE